jgi:hypothetical protein
VPNLELSDAHAVQLLGLGIRREANGTVAEALVNLVRLAGVPEGHDDLAVSSVTRAETHPSILLQMTGDDGLDFAEALGGQQGSEVYSLQRGLAAARARQSSGR